MKKFLILLLSLALLLSACDSSSDRKPMLQPVTFYYRTAVTTFSSDSGVIRGEQRDLGVELYSDTELFQLYLLGPKSEDLISPFSHDTDLVSVQRGGGMLEIRLVRNANSPEEFSHALSYACLAKTGLALEGVRKVRILVNSRGGATLEDLVLSESDILLFDSGTAPESQELTLYYTDAEGSFLLPEKRSVPLMSPAQLPQYALELLLTKPESAGLRSALPPGTAILDVSLDGGVCTVDLSGDFYSNRPEGEQAELLAVLSVVNTLCELDGINQVQLYTEGRRLSPYVLLDLSVPWVLDGSVVGPVREELGEFAGTLCLPGQRDGLLHRITVRARARSGATREAALLRLLYSRSPQNGLYAPFYGLQLPLSAKSFSGVCTVELAPDSLPSGGTARDQAIRSLIATLCSLPDIRSVVLRENGEELSLAPLIPGEDWFAGGGTLQP